MNCKKITVVAVGAALLFGAGCYSRVERDRVVSAPAPGSAVIVESPEMPAPRVEEAGPSPGAGYVWVQGYWKKVHHGWEWVPGHWERR